MSWDKAPTEPPKMQLNLLSVGNLLHFRGASFPSETPLEKTSSSFVSDSQVEILSGLAEVWVMYPICCRPAQALDKLSTRKPSSQSSGSTVFGDWWELYFVTYSLKSENYT